ncbi:hypothetical protein [Sporosarcina sp. ITBMC105]
MLFRKMTDEEKKNTSKAVELGFIFFVVALSIHSLYAYLKHSAFGSSFYILISGLVVFYVSAFVKRKQ